MDCKLHGDCDLSIVNIRDISVHKRQGGSYKSSKSGYIWAVELEVFVFVFLPLFPKFSAVDIYYFYSFLLLAWTSDAHS